MATTTLAVFSSPQDAFHFGFWQQMPAWLVPSLFRNSSLLIFPPLPLLSFSLFAFLEMGSSASQVGVGFEPFINFHDGSFKQDSSRDDCLPRNNFLVRRIPKYYFQGIWSAIFNVLSSFGSITVLIFY